MKRIPVIIAAMLALALAGCRSLSPEPVQGGPGDTSAPAVSSESTPTAAPAVESTPAESGVQPGGMFTEEQAKEKALAHAGVQADGTVFTKAELDYDDGRQVYDLEFYTDSRDEYDYEIDAYTGEVLSYSIEKAPAQSGSGGSLTADGAKALALSRVDGASEENVWEFKSDTDDGCSVYEGTIVYGGWVYEFEIDADTGEFLDWDEEPADE